MNKLGALYFSSSGRPSSEPTPKLALVAQSVERVLGKDEVGGSSPLEGSMR